MRCATGAVGIAIAVVMAGAMEDSALAGTYVMQNCDVPGRATALMYPWRGIDNHEAKLVDACATGGGLGWSLGSARQLPGGSEIGFALDKPTGARSSIRFVKIMLWYAARLAGSGQPLNVYADQRVPPGQVILTLSNGPPGSENLVAEQQLSPDSTSYEILVHCGQVGGVVSTVPCDTADEVPLLIRGMEVTLREDVPPIVMPPTGSLLDGSPQSGIRTLSYSASDLQSGLNKIEVLLDDSVVASQDLTSQCSYADFTVCPVAQNETLSIDTRAVPNGIYRLTVRVQDAAGNARLVPGEGAVVVANAPDLGALLRGYKVTARFRGASGSTLTVPYGRRVLVRGRVTYQSRPLAAGTTVELLETIDRRRPREVSVASIRTKADGSFSAALSTNRPSRNVRLAYRAVGAGQTYSRMLRLRVRSASRLRAFLRGRVIRFSGRVLSAPVPGLGKRVQLEGRGPGSAWTVFKELRTNSVGRFSGTYRLRARRPGVVLKIRAVVPSEKGYGYIGSRSHVVSLRVH